MNGKLKKMISGAVVASLLFSTLAGTITVTAMSGAEPVEEVTIPDEPVQETTPEPEVPEVTEQPAPEEAPTESVSVDTPTASTTSENTAIVISAELQAIIDRLDFSSMRLIVSTNDAAAMQADPHLIAAYENIYLLQYGTVKEAQEAFAAYYDNAEFIEPDYEVSIADNGQMTEDSNPITVLDDISGDADYSRQDRIIALIDTGASGPNVVDVVSMIGDATADDNGHGTRMMNAILSQNPDARILSIKAMDANGKGDASAIYAAIEYAIERKVSIINLSLSARSTILNKAIPTAIDEAVAAGITVVGAAGNQAADASGYVPGGCRNAYIIGAANADGTRNAASNYGATVDFNVVAESTSEAAAAFSGLVSKNGIDGLRVNEDGVVFSTDYEPSEEEKEPEGELPVESEPEESTTQPVIESTVEPVTESTAESTVEPVILPDISNMAVNHVILFYDYQTNSINDIVGKWGLAFHTAYENGRITATINPDPVLYQIKPSYVFVNWGSADSEQDITSASTYDTTTGKLTIDPAYANKSITVVTYMSDASTVYRDFIRDEYKVDDIPEQFSIASGNAPVDNDAAGVTYGTENFYEAKPNSCNSVKTTADLSSFKAGQVYYIQGGYAKYLSNFDSIAGGSVYKVSTQFDTDTGHYFGFAVSFYKVTSDKEGTTEVKALENIGGKGANETWTVRNKNGTTLSIDASTRNWLIGGCIQPSNRADGNPYIEAGSSIIKVISKASDGSVLFWYGINDPASQNFGNYFRLIPEPIQTGGVKIRKRDAGTSGTTAQGDATLEGVVLEIVNQSGKAVTISGKSYADGAVVTTIKTDAAGYAATSKTALVIGTYLIREKTASTGYLVKGTTERTFKITSSNAGTLVDMTAAANSILDTVIHGGVKIKKVDENGKVNAKLKGAVFAITNESAAAVVVNGTSYKKGATVLSITVDETGIAQCAGTVLPYGTYKIHESKAPNGYELSTWTKSFTIRTNGQVVDLTASPCVEPTTLGGVKIQKYDENLKAATAQGDASLANAAFAITNKGSSAVTVGGKSYTTGQTVLTIKTNAAGIAQSASDALPNGTYAIHEADPSTGYVVNKDWSMSFTIDATHKSVNLTSEPCLEPVIRGGVKIKKVDEEGAVSADLKDAVFSIVNQSAAAVVVNGKTYKKGEVVLTITTDEKGIAQSDSKILPYGSYEIHETKAPEGYTLSNWSKTFEIRNNGQIVDLSAYPCLEPTNLGGVKIRKVDSDLKDNTPQGDASIQGATFAVISQNDKEVKVAGKTYKKGETVLTLTTDAKGEASTTVKTLPKGTYELRETQESSGYLINSKYDQTFTVVAGKITDLTAKACEEQIIRGGLKITKQDAETVSSDTPGAGSLAGIEFTVTNASAHKVVVNGTTCEPNTVVARMTTDANGNASLAKDVLPYGTYLVQEAKTNASYNLTDKTAKKVVIRENGKIVSVDTSDKELLFTDQIIRNDIRFDKLSEATEEKMAAVAFVVTSKATGEKHVIVTDETGSFNSSKNKHTTNTNANDKVLEVYKDRKTVIPTADLDLKAGVWFGKTKAGKTVKADDTLAAFPYGDYTLQELRCESNESHELLTLELSIREDVTKLNGVNLKTLLDKEMPPSIRTKAKDSTTEEQVTAESDEVEIIDTVHCMDLVKGKKYVLKATLRNQDGTQAMTGETIEDTASGAEDVVDGANESIAIVGSTEFTATKTVEDIEVKLGTFIASDLAGKTLVVYECLYGQNKLEEGQELAKHEDLTDTDQTIYVTKIGTTAADTVTESNVGTVGEKAEIRDTVRFEGLQPGKEYTVSGVLYDKETGEPLLIGGKQVTAEQIFTPGESSGSVELYFSFDASALAGKTVVAFETVKTKGIQVASHADIRDEGQSVHYPKICTTAVDTSTGDHVAQISETTEIIDTVTYTNLVPGTEYTLRGILMDQDSGEALVADGAQITAETTFTPETADGTVEMKFSFSSKAFAGKNAVVFETLYKGEVEVTDHKDLKDEGQTVHYPEIGTTAVDSVTKDHVANATTSVTILDTVAYTGILPGKEYTLKGILYDKATGEALTVNGKDVSSETTFTPETTTGRVELAFTFDASSMAGRTVVAFETVYYEGQEVAVHADLQDEAQTVRFPDCGTTAVDGVTKTHLTEAAKTATIIDTVRYENLIVGKEYTVKGRLVDKETGKDVTADGKAVTAEKTFTAEKANGSVDIVFTFNASQLAGRTLVAFEDVLYNGNEIAAHADLNDAEQTIDIPKIGTTASITTAGKTEGTESEAGRIQNSTKTAQPASEMTITDIVKYSHLIPGKSYTVKGTLMDKASGKLFGVNGAAVTAEKTFVAEKSEGSVTLDFNFNGTGLGGCSIVVFEKLYSEGKEIAVHEDLSDTDQTVSIEMPPTPTPTPETPGTPSTPETPTTPTPETPSITSTTPVKTGDTSRPLFWAGICLAAVLGGAFACIKKRKK